MTRLGTFWALVALAVCAWVLPCVTSAEETGIRAPEGFEVSVFAGDDLAHDIYSMTLDSQGRVVVAGAGYVKVLHDDNADGVADRATLFSERPKSGAHGMLFLGNDLLCTGDESLMLLRDSDGDGQAGGEPEVWAKVRHPEHGANGLTLGPDGWIYLICGNDAGVTSKLAGTAGSPVSDPQCGAVVRFSPDGKRSEIVAHGFRNPYDLDFNADGRLFTVDADGERDHHLPWYAPTRLFDIAQGMHHGWVLQGWQRSWNRPAWMFDNVPRLAELGRGSPTGLTVYRHTQFPERYRGSVLSCCWTLGRVYALPLSADGSSYRTESEVFLETTGEVGFAPVDVVVGKEGELYVAIGGRRTRGSVFCVKYVGDRQSGSAVEASPADDLTAVLRAPQPQAAWSRSQWEPRARQLGADAFASAMKDRARPAAERIRAVEVLTDLFSGLEASLAESLLNDSAGEGDTAAQADHRVAARVAWSLARTGEPGPAQAGLIAQATKHNSPLVQRAAWEALQTIAAETDEMQAAVESAAWGEGMNSTDRRVRAAALLADRRRALKTDGDENETQLWRRHFHGQLSAEDFPAAARCFLAAKNDGERLNAVRLMELSLGDIDTHQQQADVYAGYSLNGSPQVVAAAAKEFGSKLAANFPSQDADLNREWGRLLGMLQVDDESFVDRLTELFSADSLPQDDIHYLIVLSRLPGKRSEAATRRTAEALSGLHGKMRARQMYVSRNWPQRLGEAVAGLYRHDPTLPEALISLPTFCSPSQALFANAMTPDQRRAAARHLLAAAADAASDDDRWTDELVQLIADLPNDEALPALRAAWDDFALRDSIVAVLARARQAEDRERFVEMLGSLQSRSVELSAAALTMLDQPASESEIAAAMAALKQACLAPEQSSTRQALAHLLARWTGESPTIDESTSRNPAEAYRPWFEWFRTKYPAASAQMSGLGGTDAAGWQRRIEQISWDTGDVERGKLVFEKKSCVRCHAGSSPLGPDLAGAFGRFSRADLLTAIVDPHKDVSPLYQTTQIVTASGRVYNGLVVYESPDSTLLQTTPDTTTRVAGDEIVVMRKSKVSLMPSGLLNDSTDQDIADLFAYMKTLRPRR